MMKTGKTPQTQANLNYGELVRPCLLQTKLPGACSNLCYEDHHVNFLVDMGVIYSILWEPLGSLTNQTMEIQGKTGYYRID